MATKQKPTIQPNVIIPPADDNDDSPPTQTNDQTATMSKYIPVTRKGEPIPQEPGKGRKQCPSCKMFVPPTSDTCPNPDCKHVFVKGEKQPTAKRKPKETSEHATTVKLDRYQLYRVLKGRGYDIKATVDALDESAEPQLSVPKALQPLIDCLSFEPIDGESTLVHCVSTHPNIRFEMNLLGLMKALNIKPNA